MSSSRGEDRLLKLKPAAYRGGVKQNLFRGADDEDRLTWGQVLATPTNMLNNQTTTRRKNFLNNHISNGPERIS